MEYLVENLTLTELTKWMNKNYEKSTGGEFTIPDVQQYLSAMRLPLYVGGNKIVENKEIKGVRLYHVTK